jgi:hypothetical protein
MKKRNGDFFPEKQLDYEKSEYTETYGIRRLALSLPESDHFLATPKVVNPVSAATLASRLNKFAEAVLASVGELPFLLSIESILQDHHTKVSSGELCAEQAHESAHKAIKSSLQNMVDRRGPTSPVSEAARFICSNKSLVYGMVPAGHELNEIYELCSAWHWVHFEAFGEHELARGGVKQATNLASAGAARSRAKKDRLAIVERVCQELWSRKPQLSASSSVNSLIKDINEALIKKGYKAYTEASLGKVIQTIRRRKTNSVA